ncbi:MAG: hypothetical protein J7K68_04405 [Candidatus Diapherotrites archaeon]|nr:hypothetical protein [Candidatus Diapherotrites archaeon]
MKDNKKKQPWEMNRQELLEIIYKDKELKRRATELAAREAEEEGQINVGNFPGADVIAESAARLYAPKPLYLDTETLRDLVAEKMYPDAGETIFRQLEEEAYWSNTYMNDEMFKKIYTPDVKHPELYSALYDKMKNPHFRDYIRRLCRRRELAGYGVAPLFEDIIHSLIPKHITFEKEHDKIDWVIKNAKDEFEKAMREHVPPIVRPPEAKIVDSEIYRKEITNFLVDLLKEAKQHSAFRNPVIIEIGAASGESSKELIERAKQIFPNLKYIPVDKEKVTDNTVLHDILKGPLDEEKIPESDMRIILTPNMSMHFADGPFGKERWWKHVIETAGNLGIIIAGNPTYETREGWYRHHRYLKLGKDVIHLKNRTPKEVVRKIKYRKG